MNIFVREEEKPNRVREVMFFVLMFPTLLAPFWLFYEYFMVPHYWKNRWRLHRLLKAGKVKVKYSHQPFNNIKAYVAEIDGKNYSLWIWNGNRFTFDGVDGDWRSDYIGLFCGDLIATSLTKSAIKQFKRLANENN